jgi:glycosyltransferase involved in cell wall biosynthesis
MKKQKLNNKIAFIGRYNESDIISGPEKTAKRTFQMAAEKYDPTFIQYFFDGNKYSLGQKLFGYETVPNSLNLKICTIGIVRLFFFLIKLKPALIHISAFERFAVAAVYYAMLWRVRVIYNCHGIIIHEDSEIKNEKSFYRFKNRYAEKLFLSKAKKIVFPSENSIIICQKYYNIDESKIIIIPNGIDEKFHKISSAGGRTGIVILSGGKLHTSRREFLKKYLKSADITFQLFIVGDRDYFKDVNMPGIYLFNSMFSSELAEFYKNKDIFLSLNDYDTFSISTVEAMASGLIPIVTRQTGISSMIFNDVNGYVIDYDDVESLKACINKLLKMNAVEKEIIRNNSKSIYYTLNWNKIFEKYDGLYNIPAK